MSQISDDDRDELTTLVREPKPSSGDIIKYIQDAEDAEWRARLTSTIIITASVVIAAAVVGLLSHENVVVTALIFLTACLLSVRLLLRLFS